MLSKCRYGVLLRASVYKNKYDFQFAAFGSKIYMSVVQDRRLFGQNLGSYEECDLVELSNMGLILLVPSRALHFAGSRWDSRLFLCNRDLCVCVGRCLAVAHGVVDGCG